MVKKTFGKTVKGQSGIPNKPKKLDVIGKPKGAIKALDKATAQKTVLADEAIADILESISQPEFQNSVKAYIPKGWKERYKPTLGPYKKFLSEHPDRFAIVEHDAFNFTIMKVGEELPKPKQKKKVKMPWAKTLLKAFMEWCKVTPKSERNFADFMAAVPTDKEPTSAPDNSNMAGEAVKEKMEDTHSTAQAEEEDEDAKGENTTQGAELHADSNPAADTCKENAYKLQWRWHRNRWQWQCQGCQRWCVQTDCFCVKCEWTPPSRCLATRYRRQRIAPS